MGSMSRRILLRAAKPPHNGDMDPGAISPGAIMAYDFSNPQSPFWQAFMRLLYNFSSAGWALYSPVAMWFFSLCFYLRNTFTVDKLCPYE